MIPKDCKPIRRIDRDYVLVTYKMVAPFWVDGIRYELPVHVPWIGPMFELKHDNVANDYTEEGGRRGGEFG